MRIYLAGPMTGMPDWNFPAFRAAEADLERQGHVVVSPVNIDAAVWGFTGGEHLHPVMTRRATLHVCYAALDTCEAIYMLKGWEKNSGSISELAHAQATNMILMYELGALRARVSAVDPSGRLAKKG